MKLVIAVPNEAEEPSGVVDCRSARSLRFRDGGSGPVGILDDQIGGE